jgi:6,7-dimethyl-8-ribityllumazine synthase
VGKPGKKPSIDFLLEVKVGIVVSRYNEEITNSLYRACERTLLQHGISRDNLHTLWVPGSLEIPITLKRFLQKNPMDGAVAIGAVIRGETPHFEYVSKGVLEGVLSVSLSTSIPIVFGVLTCDTYEQAKARAGKRGNKGEEFALTLLSLLSEFYRWKI